MSDVQEVGIRVFNGRARETVLRRGNMGD